jgi:hypothetical protein
MMRFEVLLEMEIYTAILVVYNILMFVRWLQMYGRLYPEGGSRQ